MWHTYVLRCALHVLIVVYTNGLRMKSFAKYLIFNLFALWDALKTSWIQNEYAEAIFMHSPSLIKFSGIWKMMALYQKRNANERIKSEIKIAQIIHPLVCWNGKRRKKCQKKSLIIFCNFKKSAHTFNAPHSAYSTRRKNTMKIIKITEGNSQPKLAWLI